MSYDYTTQPAVMMSETGECTISAEAVSSRFGWSAETFLKLMRRGLVLAVLERGTGDDEGRWRVSVRSGNRRWTATVHADGTLLEERFDVVGERA